MKPTNRYTPRVDKLMHMHEDHFAKMIKRAPKEHIIRWLKQDAIHEIREMGEDRFREFCDYGLGEEWVNWLVSGEDTDEEVARMERLWNGG